VRAASKANSGGSGRRSFHPSFVVSMLDFAMNASHSAIGSGGEQEIA